MSVLYSVPPFRLKSVAGLDWFINMWGFGALTAYAGWASTGIPVSGPGEAVILGFCPLFAGLYPLTQLYQMEEDGARGDDTLAIRLGVRGSLWLAIGAVVLAFLLFAVAGVRSEWSPSEAVFRGGGLLIAGAAWLGVLVEWLSRSERLTRSDHEKRMYRALAAWAVTDAAVLVAFAR
jgi:4-hydroxybenzoate polyprenyltransferase